MTIYEEIAAIMQRIADEQHIMVKRVEIEWMNVSTAERKKFLVRLVDIHLQGGGA